MLENRLKADGSAYLAEPYSPTSVLGRTSAYIFEVAMHATAFKSSFLRPSLNFLGLNQLEIST